MKKRAMGILMAAAVAAMAAGCGSGTKTEEASASTKASPDTTATKTEEQEEAPTEEVSQEGSAVDGSYKLGIAQFGEHASLDNCRIGFLQGLEEAGIKDGENLTVDLQNAAFDTGIAAQIADSFVSTKVDMICAIATPCAAAAYNAAMESDIPVVYTAVSDPAAAGLANEDGSSVGNITGSSDILGVADQLALIREILPDAEKIGIMYTTSEANSMSTIEEYKAKAGDYGFEIVEGAITTTADIPMVASDLISKVDCLNNLTDNTVVGALPSILELTNEAGIPIFGSEIEQVKIGCLAAAGIDYVELGRQTGLMAAKILTGEAQASDMDFITSEEYGLYLNTAVADQLGIGLSDDLKGRALESFDTVATE